ncbi:MAG: shikimate dehydrogenase [Lachnospiraceae bacterium]|nr:shikimate dehydrogenase [Lachnospiraceae bacterium]
MYGITGHTRFGGLLGSPVAHSLSPAMHNLSFRTLGIDYVYLAFDVGEEKLKETVSVFRDLNTYGFNLTMPDKKRIIEYIDSMSEAAELTGAVNTVVNENGTLVGHNTDGIGYTESVREQGFEPSGKEVTLLGAGGAGCAAAVQLALDGVKKLHIVNRRSGSWKAAGDLADRINKHTSCLADLTDMDDERTLADLIGRSDLLTNATSVGMAPDTEETPIRDASVLRKELVVSDIIYNPRETLLMKQASAAGCRTFNGMYMLLWQGAAAFRLWTGADMPVDLVRNTYFTSVGA